MDDSLEKFKTRLHLFTAKEQIELTNNRLIMSEKIKREQILWNKIITNTLNAMKNKLIIEK